MKVRAPERWVRPYLGGDVVRVPCGAGERGVGLRWARSQQHVYLSYCYVCYVIDNIQVFYTQVQLVLCVAASRRASESDCGQRLSLVFQGHHVVADSVLEYPPSSLLVS